jgi:hypothetical protein
MYKGNISELFIVMDFNVCYEFLGRRIGKSQRYGLEGRQVHSKVIERIAYRKYVFVGFWKMFLD